LKNRIYYDLYLKEIKEIREAKIRPSLLLHVCCAPCSCEILRYLSKDFNITVYYSNSNIYPYEEYQHRYEELLKYQALLKEENIHFEIVTPPYQNEEYQEYMKEYLLLPEFSERCWRCYRYRMRDSFIYARQHHFDYCTTVMSVSRYKNTIRLNEIGEQLQTEFPEVKYLYADFKKEQGEEKANKRAKEIGLYRQPYCGCLMSLKEYKKRISEH